MQIELKNIFGVGSFYILTLLKNHKYPPYNIPFSTFSKQKFRSFRRFFETVK